MGPAAARALQVLQRAPALSGRLLPLTGPLYWGTLYMQVRTRVIDDMLRAFVADGGRQVLLLGAGYDSRARRFGDELRGVTFFEVDHPATQEHKRRVLAGGAPGGARGGELPGGVVSKPAPRPPPGPAAPRRPRGAGPRS